MQNQNPLAIFALSDGIPFSFVAPKLPATHRKENCDGNKAVLKIRNITTRPVSNDFLTIFGA